MNIGDIFFAFRGDSEQLKADALKAGDDAGQTLGERIRSKLTAANIGTALGAALGAAMIPALKMAEEYDAAMDSIRAGTGATGEALKGLEDSFRNAAGRVKEDIGLTAQVMADLNTRTGLTGQALEDLTVDVIEFSRVTKTDAVSNVANITRLFGDWSIATEDQSETMDKLLRASQATGLGVDSLMQTVVAFGAPLRALGISFEESIALLGKWEKEGVNIETMLAGARMAVANFAKAGIDPSEGLPALIEKVMTLDRETGFLAVKQIVGQKAANDWYMAIREGRFNVEDLVDAIQNGSETVGTAASDMRDFGDGIAELKNKVKLAIGPILQDFSGLADELGNAIYLLPLLGGAFGRMAGAAASVVGKGFVALLGRLAPSLVAEGIALGTTTGVAQGNAQVAAATGTNIVKAMVARIAAMSIPFAAAGTTVGTVVGAAMAAGIAAAIVGVVAIAVLAWMDWQAAIERGTAKGKEAIAMFAELNGGIRTQAEATAAAAEAQVRALDQLHEAQEANRQDLLKTAPILGPLITSWRDLTAEQEYNAAAATADEEAQRVLAETLEQDAAAAAEAYTARLGEVGNVLRNLGPDFELTAADAARLAERFDVSADDVTQSWRDLQSEFAASDDAIRAHLEGLGDDFDLTAEAAQEMAILLGASTDDIERVFAQMRGSVVPDLEATQAAAQEWAAAQQTAADDAATAIEAGRGRIKSAIEGITGAMSALGTSGEATNYWTEFKDGAADNIPDVEARIEQLREQIRKLDEVNTAELGPNSLATWIQMRTGAQDELGALESFLANHGEIAANALPIALANAGTPLTNAVENYFSIPAEAAELLRLQAIADAAATAAAQPDAFREAARQLGIDVANYTSLPREALETLNRRAGELAGTTSSALPGNLSAQRRALAGEMDYIDSTVRGTLSPLPGVAGAAGTDIGSELARTLAASVPKVKAAASKVASAVQSIIKMDSPAKEGPWSEDGGPIAWAENAAARIVGGLVDILVGGAPDVRRATEQVADAGRLDDLFADLPARLVGNLAAAGRQLSAGLGSLLASDFDRLAQGPALGALGLDFAPPPLSAAVAGPLGRADSFTIRHELDMSPDTVRALRDAGYDDLLVARVLGDLLAGAESAAGLRWSTG